MQATSTLLAPSILSADFTNLKRSIEIADKAGADWIHCDIMDGNFVPNITFGPFIVQAIAACSSAIIDTHLMIAAPDRFIEDFDPLEIARRYGDLGAAAYSVLTDRNFFQGSNDYLQMVSRSFSLPVLRKDFIIDESQIFQSRLIGADAILLIVAALDPSQFDDYLQLALSIGLHVLVEVHDRKELDRALEKGALMIGVNNRDLKDFSLKLETSVALRPFIPSDVVAVAESGMKTVDDISLIEQASFDAVLIGEGLHTSSELREVIWS